MSDNDLKYKSILTNKYMSSFNEEPIQFIETMENNSDYENDDCLEGNCENFEDDTLLENENFENDSSEKLEDENFEDNSQIETFKDTDNKDMELWTCYPSKKETFQNSDDTLFYTSSGDVKQTTQSSILGEENQMTKLYLHLSIAVIVLIIVYLLFNSK